MAAALNERAFVLPNAGALAEASADQIGHVLAKAVRLRGRAALALSGGGTPRLYLPLLADESRLSTIPWELISVFWADERCVPPDHPESNYKTANDLLLSKVPIPAHSIHRIRGELPPKEAAAHYVQELSVYFGGLPRFDLLLLGIGTDGHTASLFPDTADLYAADYACAIYAPAFGKWRVTLTLPVLNNAAHVMFIVSGSGKASVMRKLMDAEIRRDFPAGRVRPGNGKLTWICDSGAASLLNNHSLGRVP